MDLKTSYRGLFDQVYILGKNVKKGNGKRLANCQVKNLVKVVGIFVGEQDIGRLAGLGLVKGTLLLVLKNRGASPVIVKLGETRIALGRDYAVRIEVEDL